MRGSLITRLLVTAWLCLVTGTLFAQQTGQDNYDAHALWKPLFYPHNGTQFRSAGGAPGPAYWQNHADYQIDCTLDTAQKRLTGSVEISYTNNSPDDLPFLWLQLDQNIYREDSRGQATSPVSGGRFANQTFTQGYEIKSLTVDQGGKSIPGDYIVNDTRMQIRLKEPLKAAGGKIKIRIQYAFTIPQYGTDRMGRLHTQNGWIYEMAQWYPRMEVYDDIQGWNTLPYTGAGEFYLEYGNIDYSVTAPAGMVVVGAGQLQNPKDVLTDLERKRLDEASRSDKTVFIRTADDVANPSTRPQQGMLTWRFHMENTRDVAWAASEAFIWDAARINLPDGKKALAQSVYPIESAGDDAWTRSTEFTKACIEHYSQKWYPFPYPVATNVAGIVHGMEYPGFVFCGYRSTGQSLWGVTIHEFGHTWFPMIVGSDERRFAWMDEGFNTFINDECTEWFNGGEFYQKPDQHMEAPGLFSSGSDPIITLPAVIQSYNLGNAAYSKPALGLEILRNVVLGKDRFDYAFRTYIQRWAYKHPAPWDFFRTMENAAGEDLAWFWRAWFFTNDRLDQAIEGVKYANNDTTQGALITIKNLDAMALPAIVRVQEVNGRDSTFTLPVEIWQRGGTWTFQYPSHSTIRAVELDPDHLLPDVNPGNNSWREIPQGITPQSVIEKYLNAIGGESKLATVKDLRMEATGSIQGQQIHFLRVYKLPGRFKMVVRVPSMENRIVSSMVVNGDSVKIQRMGQDVPVNSQTRESLKQQLDIFPEQHYLDQGYSLSLAGVQEINGQDAYMVNVTDPQGNTSTVYYNASSGLKMKEVVEETSSSGETISSATTFGDYKEVNGIKFPFTQTSDNGGMLMKTQVDTLTINSGISNDDFK
jgi:hypothetical protein